MATKVSIVVLLQFVLPFVVALSREFFRTAPRSGWRRLVLGVTSVVLSIIPMAACGFITGSSPHGAAVDWYLMLCLFSFGTVPVGVAAITYLVTSSIAEPLVGLFRPRNVAVDCLVRPVLIK